MMIMMKSDYDDDLNVLVIVTAGAAVPSLNSWNGGLRAPRKFKDKLRWTNKYNNWDKQEFKSHLIISTGCFQYILNIMTPNI